MTHPLSHIPVPPNDKPELSHYEGTVSTPFFDPEACARSALECAVQARRNAWQRRALGDEDGFYKSMERVRWYAARARIWANMIEYVEMEALDA